MEIDDRHVEWAVINRLKVMLDTPPRTRFEVTQSFALFTTILLWTKQRLWIGCDERFTEKDHRARDLREKLRDASIFDAPWSLSKQRPFSTMLDPINTDFEGMTAEQFIAWLRNAIAHSDGRGRKDGGGSMRPINRPIRGNEASLEGFEIRFAEARGSSTILTLCLYRADMIRIGSVLADMFCKALSGNNEFFERDAATARIVEAA